MSAKNPRRSESPTSADRIGLSEFVRNDILKEIYFRGYAFSSRGPLIPVARLSDGSLIPARRTRIRRPDILSVLPDCPDVDCGFDVVLPWSEGEAGTLEIVGRLDGGEDVIAMPLDARTARVVPAALRLRGLRVDLAAHRVALKGDLAGEIAGLTFARLTLNDLPLTAKMTLAPPSGTGGGAPSKSDFSLAAPLRTRMEGEEFQLFPAVGDTIRAVFTLAKSEYAVEAAVPIEKNSLVEAVGAIHAVRFSKAENRLDVRGAFVGPFTQGAVRVFVDGAIQPRAARLEAAAVIVPADLTEAYDAPFSEWCWCDTLSAPLPEKAVLRAELHDGQRIIGSTQLRLTSQNVALTSEPLAPSYFVSQLQPVFDGYVATAVPQGDPLVLMIFPGDLFATFGGGPARVMEMARYLTEMGYAVGLVDRVADEGAGTDLPQWASGLFRFRAGVRRQEAPEMVRLALDRMSRETSAEALQNVLRASLEPRERGGDLLARRTDPVFNAFASYICSISDPDFVIANFAWAAPVLQALPARVCKLLDLHDVQHLRGLSHQAMTGEDEFLTDLAGEIEAWSKADYLLAIQSEDKDFVLKAQGRNNIVLTGHALPVRRSPSTDAPTVMFIGNRYPPNIKGLRDFILHAWPVVTARFPEAELHVVGSVVSEITAVPRGVVLRGIVEDLAQAYDAAAVVINPVTFGSGLNIKSVEALCHGKCLVTTPFGVKGLPVTPDAAVIVEADAMGGAVADLLGDAQARARVESAAHAFAVRELSPERIFRELFNTMELCLYA